MTDQDNNLRPADPVIPTEIPAVVGEAVAIVPQGCTGASLSFDPGVLHVSKDGSGYIAISEEHFSLEDDRGEGPDGPEGSVHWITRMDASEVVALRDFLNGTTPTSPPAHDPALLARVREVVKKAEHVCGKIVRGEISDADSWRAASSMKTEFHDLLADLDAGAGR